MTSHAPAASRHALAVEAAEPLEMEYFGPRTSADPLRREVASAFVPLSVLSGLCVGVAWLALLTENALGLLCVVVFGITIWQGIAVGVRLRRAKVWLGRVAFLDLIALIGLAVVALAPIGYSLYESSVDWKRLGEAGLASLGLAYLAMGLTSVRHIWMYAELSQWAEDLFHRRLARSLQMLGYIKAIYETLWLGLCCAVPLLAAATDLAGGGVIYLAIGAAVGCIGYGLIWIWMMIVHIRLARAHRSRGGW